MWRQELIGEIFMVLIERHEQLSKLNDLFLDSCRGEGRVALITGAAACGKTALLTEFGARVTDAGGQFLFAAGSYAEKSMRFGVIEQLSRAARLPNGISGLPKADDQAHARMVHDILAALLRLTERGPLVVAVDDIGQADPASLQCLLYLARRLRGSRLMMIFAESLDLRVPDPSFRAELSRQPFLSSISLP